MVHKLSGRVILSGNTNVGPGPDDSSKGLEAGARQFYSGVTDNPHSIFPNAPIGSTYLDTAGVTFYTKTGAATWAAIGQLG